MGLKYLFVDGVWFVVEEMIVIILIEVLFKSYVFKKIMLVDKIGEMVIKFELN